MNALFISCIVRHSANFIQHSLNLTGYKRVRLFSLPAETVRHIWLPPRLSVISRFLRDYRPQNMASCRDYPCDSASCQDSRQEAKLHGQSLQEAIFQAQQSRQEARDRGQPRRKPNMTDSFCRKRKLADSFIPCAHPSSLCL